MSEFFSQFHFLRPLWLLALIPCLLIIVQLWHQHHTQGSWQKVIAPELLQHLLHEKAQRASRLPLILLLTGWVAGCIALAGPAWQKMPVPVSKTQQPLVVVVDLSYYMLAEDLKPDRLTRTRYKLHDLFRLRRDGVSAIVAYAGSAHAVAPLTDDSRTLSNLVNAMNPGIMPVQGNKPEEGIKQAKLLLEQGSNESGDILLITGNVTENQAAGIHDLLDKTGIRLSVLGVGTEQGAPIPLPDGGYLKNQQGTIVVPQLNRVSLRELAVSNGGQYRDMTVDDSDLKALLPKAGLEDDVLIVERDFDQWHDAGYWLLLLILPLALAGFRRGWLAAVMLCILLPATPEAQALDWKEGWKEDWKQGWKNIWQTPDQQGQKALKANDPEKAASLFNDDQWKGEALFQSGNFEEAAKAFAQADTARSIYNKGNALAKAGKLQEALDAYDEALKQQPDFADAEANLKLVEDLLKQQQEQQKQDQKNQDQQNKDKNQNDQKDNDQQDQQDQQNKDDQQSGENQSQEQQSEQQQSDQNQTDQQESDNQNKNAEEQQKQQQNQNQNQQEQSAQDQEQEQKEQQASQPSKQQQSEEQPKDEEQAEQQAQIESDSVQSPEKQAVESWLRTIPDDPGGLLRRKFLQQQQQRQGRN